MNWLRDSWNRVAPRLKDKKAVWYLAALLGLGTLLMLVQSGFPLNRPSLGTKPPEKGLPAGTDLPGKTVEAFKPEETPDGDLFTRERALEMRLEEVFAQVQDVGRVRVLLSLTPDKETVYAADADVTESYTRETDAEGGSRETRSKSSQEKTILVTDQSGEDRPLILREIAPQIAGVVIIAEGGDSVFVKEALIKAACTALSMEANKVQVLKMKGK